MLPDQLPYNPAWPFVRAAEIADRTAVHLQNLVDFDADIRSRYDVSPSGLIQDFGQFQGEPVWVAILWDYALDQFADETAEDLNGYQNSLFNIDSALSMAFPDLASVKAVCLWQTDNGFIHKAVSSKHDAAAWATLISEEADEKLGPVCSCCSERMGNTSKCERCGEFSDELGDDIVAYTLPSHWASYLINGDASGLDDGEAERVDAWLAAQSDIGGGALDCSDNAHFQHSNDAGTLPCSVLTFTFPQTGGRLAPR